MKKMKVLVLIACMAGCMAVAGCGSDAENETAVETDGYEYEDDIQKTAEAEGEATADYVITETENALYGDNDGYAIEEYGDEVYLSADEAEAE